MSNPLDANPDVNAKLEWQNIQYPFVGDKPQVQSEKGVLRFVGLLSDYRLKLNAQLTQDYLPKSTLVLDSNGSLDAINISKLELKSTTGNLLTSGQIGWKDKTTFDIKALADNFNPAIFMPDMAGKLSLDSHFKGQFTDCLLYTSDAADE